MFDDPEYWNGETRTLTNKGTFKMLHHISKKCIKFVFNFGLFDAKDISDEDLPKYFDLLDKGYIKFINGSKRLFSTYNPYYKITSEGKEFLEKPPLEVHFTVNLTTEDGIRQVLKYMNENLEEVDDHGFFLNCDKIHPDDIPNCYLKLLNEDYIGFKNFSLKDGLLFKKEGSFYYITNKGLELLR